MDKNKIDAEIKALQSGFMGNDAIYMGKRNGIEVGYLAAVKKYEAKIERYEKALKAAQVALETCYDVINFPANGETRQDAAIVAINEALSGEGGFDYQSREFEKGKPAPEGAIKAMHERWEDYRRAQRVPDLWHMGNS